MIVNDPPAGLTGWPHSEPAGSTRRVFMGILDDLDVGRMVPGQRLVETELAQRFEVGRNAVREAMQHLASRGVVDLSRNRSPAIRKLDPAECFEVLDVAEALTRLAAGSAARRYRPEHAAGLGAAMNEMDAAAATGEAAQFARARRGFYRNVLLIGGNRELQRLFPAIGTHIIHAQYPSPRMQGIRLADYHAIARAIMDGNAEAAEAAAAAHVVNVRAVVRELARA